MTTANVAQAIQETIATNPNAPAAVAQTLLETIATNPAPPAVAAQTFIEVIASTFVPPYRGTKPEITQFIEATSEDTAPWLVVRMPRFVPLTAAVSARPFLWIAL